MAPPPSTRESRDPLMSVSRELDRCGGGQSVSVEHAGVTGSVP